MLRDAVRYFMVVARTGSIRAASATLGVAQSAISRQLQTLEYEFGTMLIERTPRGVRLTAAGEALLKHSKNVSFQFERFWSELYEIDGAKPGHVRVAIIESITSYVFPRAVASYVSDYPGTTFSVNVDTTSSVIEAVLNDTVDFGICLNANSAGIQTLSRVFEPLFVIMPEAHALAGYPSLSLNDISAFKLAVSSRSGGLGYALESSFHRAQLSLNIALETNSLELLRQFVSIGRGIAVMTLRSCIGSLLASDFVAIPVVDDKLEAISTDIIAAPGRLLPLPSERFMERINRELMVTLDDPGAWLKRKMS
ncbi:LysR family transcriptional regulator [Burkholderia sp. L27(2015)]|uniref:LysR family transcriptional regulator n=1 Tax=Burkholderia sp. L27(2015) TaxID=1641858 RepID=UPI00131CBA11|nr:LysR family transcriptional regulator [Burkholderia sp. L27(2015)]